MKTNDLIFQKGKFAYLCLLFLVVIFYSCKTENAVYVCTPCDLECDELIYTKPGIYSNCGMSLMKKSDLITNENQFGNKVEVQTGSGSFFMEGGMGNEENTIEVHYHKPKNFTVDSEILLVIPGAGRNGDTYRDSWIEVPEKNSILILSPMYPKKYYSFDEYHLGGLIKNSNLNNSIERIEGTNKIKLFEDKLTFDSNTNVSEWLFNDFDRIFDSAVETLNSNQTAYNLFGHSAGGHILHRFVLFQEHTKANKILASNASFYTLPNFSDSYPFGLKDTPVNDALLKKAFKKNLVVFLGEEDNENKTGGSFLQSKSADLQGNHRLERGKFFFYQAKQMATKINTDFNWELKIIPGVGHDYKNMGLAASYYLYSQ
ncbi:hypothetical protein [Hwangdonia lutea]|uniref:Alpha/beta hydrolase n=1 Tax=Hwangdonia lutea TaxID=3075823 RepID=A0AA97EN59_9FLAO|nr:hypothetical protein [Hwangdonia sp. SCSIO 19198]WOD43534.1 hypothetical protein RNZ46_16215 [Hwangdonia sp. SCSIO 19198]